MNYKVPKCIQKYCDYQLENYPMLRKNPNFLMKTLAVCQDCFLRITEFNEEAGAKGGVHIKQGGLPKHFRIVEAQSQYKPLARPKSARSPLLRSY